MLPDNRRFGVFWMSRDALASALDLQGAFNDLSVRLLPEASVPELLRQLDTDLEPLRRIECCSFYCPVDLTVVPGWTAVLPVGPRHALPGLRS